MIALAGTIISSTLIFVIFRLFEKYKIDTFQAIVFNYFTAFICGVVLYSHELSLEIWKDLNWLPYTLLVSILFISLFFVMGKSAQKNGVAMTSISVKMSLAVSMIGMILIYNETITLFKIIGILLALSGVLLISFEKNKSRTSTNSLKMLLILFIGSGILDLALNYTQQHVLIHLTPALFSSFGFGLAGITILMSLYLFIFIRCFYLSINARDRFCRLVIGGLSLVFITTLFINIGMVIGLLPVVGMPMPLISQGGSSLISFYIAFGIIISMASHKKLVPR